MTTARDSRLALDTITDRLSASMPWLDSAAKSLHAVFEPVLGQDAPAILKDALYGTWLGHPLHPVLVDLPIGFWTSSLVLDATGHDEAADLLLKAGTLSALGAAASGAAQWQDLQEMEAPRRVGALHAILNVAAVGCYGVSWALRGRDARGAGQIAALAGITIASASSMLGGDLAYKLGIGVSRVAFDEPEADWAAVASLDDLAEGKMTRVETDSGPVVLVRNGADVLAASATCTHVGAPLDEGELHAGCVTCPWHGSEFDLRDGHVVHGPATAPLNVFETRVQDGQVEIRIAS